MFITFIRFELFSIDASKHESRNMVLWLYRRLNVVNQYYIPDSWAIAMFWNEFEKKFIREYIVLFVVTFPVSPIDLLYFLLLMLLSVDSFHWCFWNVRLAGLHLDFVGCSYFQWHSTTFAILQNHRPLTLNRFSNYKNFDQRLRQSEIPHPHHHSLQHSTSTSNGGLAVAHVPHSFSDRGACSDWHVHPSWWHSCAFLRLTVRNYCAKREIYFHAIYIERNRGMLHSK